MIKIGIVDDHLVFREAVAHLLSKEKKIQITISAHNGRDLLNKLLTSQSRPSIILLDIVMPVMSGREVMSVLAKEYPNIKIIILSFIDHEDTIIDFLNLGVKGYLQKGCSSDILLEAIHRVNNYETVFLEDDYSLRTFAKTIFATKPNKGLSDKELMFLKLCANGALSYKEIAERLDLSINTVNRYREELFKKLGLKSRTALAVYAIQTGLVLV